MAGEQEYARRSKDLTRLVTLRMPSPARAAALAAAACLGAALLATRGVARRGALFGDPFYGETAPPDPVVSPLLMGYDAQQGAVNELARVAGPLGGAFSPDAQAQLMQGLARRGWVVEDVLSPRPLPDRAVQVRGLPSEDELQRQALASYEDHAQMLQGSALLGAEPSAYMPILPDYRSGGTLPEDEMSSRKALASYRQGLASSDEKPVVLDHLGMDEDGTLEMHAPSAAVGIGAAVPGATAGTRFPPAERRGLSGAARRRASLRQVQRLYSRLQNPRDRAAAASLVREDASATALRAAVAADASLHAQEGKAEKELRLTRLKIKDARQVAQLGRQELARYHAEMLAARAREAGNVHYLKATHNFAEEARKEVLDAQARDAAAAKVLASAPAVLRGAHEAQVKARITDDPAGLRRAGEALGRELHKVEHARAGEAAAAKDRADAKENAFVATVIDRVRRQRFARANQSVKAIAMLGAKGHEEAAEAAQELQVNRARQRLAREVLRRAKTQDKIAAAARDTGRHVSKAIAALDAAEAAGRRLDAGARRAGEASAAAAREEQSAKRSELAAASMHE